MVLRLQMRRLDDQGPVDLAEVVCSGQPLILGRNASSDVVLEDPDRLVSSAHARIEPAEDGYRLVDTSVNGILLNEEKLPSGAVVTLAVGDVVQVMRYELTVSTIDHDGSDAPGLPRPALPGVDSGSSSAVATDPLALLDAELVPSALDTGSSNTEDISELLAQGALQGAPNDAHPDVSAADALHQGSDLESLFVAPAVGPDPALISPASKKDSDLDWWQEAESVEAVDVPLELSAAAEGAELIFEPAPSLDESVPQDVPSATKSQNIEVDPFAALDRMGTDQLVEPAKPSIGAATQSSSQQSSNSSDLAPLLAGLGLPPDTPLTAEQLNQLGEVTRILLDGVIGSVRTRAEVKNQLRMVRTVLQANDNNPLKVAVDTPDALELLFLRPRSGFLDAVTAAKATMADLSSHELAMLAGFRKATREMRSKIAPTKIEESFDSALLSVVGKHRFWDHYVELYERFCRQDDYLDEVFASAYDEMIHQLETK